jgi:hypothetical protein
MGKLPVSSNRLSSMFQLKNFSLLQLKILKNYNIFLVFFFSLSNRSPGGHARAIKERPHSGHLAVGPI